MNPQEQIKALAELDGCKWIPYVEGTHAHWLTSTGTWLDMPPDYLTSYDAIIPLIQKQDEGIMEQFFDEVGKLIKYAYFVYATPSQLCEALLRATGKWKDND
jgi:hypothetical protein